MNYEDMSDWEVTKRVVEIQCAGQFIEYHPQRDSFEPMSTGVMDDSLYITTESGREQKIDCCSNPSDAWLIIVENGITVGNYDGDGIAFCNFRGGCHEELWDFEALDKNPLRAAMICFLKMKDAEK